MNTIVTGVLRYPEYPATESFRNPYVSGAYEILRSASLRGFRILHVSLVPGLTGGPNKDGRLSWITSLCIEGQPNPTLRKCEDLIGEYQITENVVLDVVSISLPELTKKNFNMGLTK